MQWRNSSPRTRWCHGLASRDLTSSACCARATADIFISSALQWQQKPGCAITRTGSPCRLLRRTLRRDSWQRSTSSSRTRLPQGLRDDDIWNSWIRRWQRRALDTGRLRLADRAGGVGQQPAPCSARISPVTSGHMCSGRWHFLLPLHWHISRSTDCWESACLLVPIRGRSEERRGGEKGGGTGGGGDFRKK